jgi:hypothetical protein
MRMVIALGLFLIVGCVPESSNSTMREKYEKIEVGMSYDRVRKIVGTDGEELFNTDGVRVIGWRNGDGSRIAVAFYNDEVYSKSLGQMKPEIDEAEAKAAAEAKVAEKREKDEVERREAARKAKAEAEAKAEAKRQAKIDADLAAAREAVGRRPAKRFGEVALFLDTVKAMRTKDGQRLSGEIINSESRREVRAIVTIALLHSGKVFKTERVEMHLNPGECRRFTSDEHSSQFKMDVTDIKVR